MKSLARASFALPIGLALFGAVSIATSAGASDARILSP